MADQFNLNDALGSGQQTQSQGQNNQWGGPGQQYPGPGQQYPGPGQQYPGPGQQYPGGYPGPGQQYQGGYPAPGPGQPYPGYPGGQPGGYPGFPGFPAPGQQYPGAPMPGQPTDPKAAGQFGPTPSAPAPSAPAGPLKLPYCFPLTSGIMPGLVLTIQGVVNPNAERWVVDFKINNDIVFHFNPRFHENPNVMVRNSFFKGHWGSEERAAATFPFQRAQQFLVQIFCEAEQFRVHVNNVFQFSYKYRNRDFAQVKELNIHGDITLNGVTAAMM